MNGRKTCKEVRRERGERAYYHKLQLLLMMVLSAIEFSNSPVVTVIDSCISPSLQMYSVISSWPAPLKFSCIPRSISDIGLRSICWSCLDHEIEAPLFTVDRQLRANCLSGNPPIVMVANPSTGNSISSPFSLNSSWVISSEAT